MNWGPNVSWWAALLLLVSMAFAGFAAWLLLTASF